MGKIIASIMLALMVSGCATTTPKEAYIPVIWCPAPPSFSRPPLSSPSRIASSDGEFVQAVYADVETLKEYARQLESIIAVYSAFAKTSPQLSDDGKTISVTIPKAP